MAFKFYNGLLNIEDYKDFININKNKFINKTII